MRTKDGIIGCIVLVVLLISCWCTWLAGQVQGFHRGVSAVQQEAVKRGVGEFYVIQDQDELSIGFTFLRGKVAHQ